MSAAEYAMLFAAIGIVLLVAEMFIPSHATLGLAGMAAMLIAVGCCFVISSRAGFLALSGLIILTPLGILIFLKVWPQTYVGKRMTLGAVVGNAVTSPAPAIAGVRVGDLGVTRSELRPVGMIEINGERIEAISQLGLLPTGRKVVVVEIVDGRPAVRASDDPTTQPPPV